MLLSRHYRVSPSQIYKKYSSSHPPYTWIPTTARFAASPLCPAVYRLRERLNQTSDFVNKLVNISKTKKSENCEKLVI